MKLCNSTTLLIFLMEVFSSSKSRSKRDAKATTPTDYNVTAEGVATITDAAGQPVTILPEDEFIVNAVGTATIVNGTSTKAAGDTYSYNFTGPVTAVPVVVPTKPVIKEVFIDLITRYLQDKYFPAAGARDALPDVSGVLAKIYSSIDDWDEILIFVSNAIFTTGGFLNLSQLDAPAGDKWISRGILQITTQPNYQHLATLTNNPDFVDHPEILASLSDLATDASIKFWRDLVTIAQNAPGSTFVLTWESALKLLNTKEVQPDTAAEYALNKENRLAVYNEILDILPAITKKASVNPTKTKKSSSKIRA